MDSRRRALLNGKFLSYTGEYSLYGSGAKGYIVLKSSGVLNIRKKTCDLCLVAGGKNGTNGRWSTVIHVGGDDYEEWRNGDSGKGGGVTNYKEQELSGEYNVIIGNAEKSTSVGDSYSASGAASTPTYPFDDRDFQVADLASNGYVVSKTGTLDGGSGLANTGNGGGGSSKSYGAGNGGSGVVIIRWGYNSEKITVATDGDMLLLSSDGMSVSGDGDTLIITAKGISTTMAR